MEGTALLLLAVEPSPPPPREVSGVTATVLTPRATAGHTHSSGEYLMTEPTHGPTHDDADRTAGTSPSEPPSESRADGTQAIPGHETRAMPQYTYPIRPDGGTETAQPSAVGVGLADDPQATSPRAGRRRTGLLIGGLAAVLVLGGAGVFAAQQLSGGGAQPADVLPGDAYGYVRLDIDPSAGQKIAAVRFLSKLPQVKDTLGADDPRRKLWELASKDAGSDCVAKFSYDSDIAPWLGDRVGAAIRPGGTQDKPNVAVAIQVTDESAAKDTLTRLFACDKGGADTDLRMMDGYAIVTPSGAGDATLAAVAKGSLAQNATFTQDMAALGEQGVVSTWFDLSNLVTEMQKLSGDASAAPVSTSGRFAAALRFDPDYVELAGIVRGASAAQSVPGDGTEIADLPDDTAVALHVSGADQLLDGAWPDLKKQIDSLGQAGRDGDVLAQIEQELHVTLPDDLKVLLGRSFTVAVPQQDLNGDSPTAGAKIVTSNAPRAGELLDTIDQLLGAGGVLKHTVEGNKVYVATTPDYLATLKAGGRLGDSPAFKAAVGDVSRSNVAIFVDLDKLEQAYLDETSADERAFVESLRAVGVNGSTTGKGEATFTVRLVGN